MRVTPLLCFQCGSWFQPKTKRKNRFCSNACRQAHYYNKEPIHFSFQGTDKGIEICFTILQSYSDNIDHGPRECSQIMFEKDYTRYCMLIYEYGEDAYGINCKTWLSNKTL